MCLPVERTHLKISLISKALLVLATLGLGACTAVGPDYKQPPAQIPSEWNALDETVPPATSPGAPGDLSQWWQTLNDPLLSELMGEALQANLDLRNAQARLLEARSRRAAAASFQYPGVNASAGANRNRFSKEAGSGTTVDVYSAGFDASWELDVFGGVRRAVEAADADVQSSQASLDATRVSLVAEVASSYIEVRAQQSLLAISRSNLESQSETLQLTDWRAQAGLVSIQDVEQARSNRDQTRAQIPFIETSLAEAEHSLDVLLGRPPGTLHQRLTKTTALPEIPEQIAVGIPADTLRQRPDVNAAERKLAAETARVGVAEAARYPNFALTGSIGLEALTLGSLGSADATRTSLGAGVTAPIFDAGRLRALVDVQDAVREQALVAYEQTVLIALQEVENALVNFARNRERGEALSAAVKSARTAAVLARERYSAGLIDFQSVLTSERTVLVLEESLARNRANGVLALIRLYKALGGGWSPQDESATTGKEAP
jgi:NodT family efflux transporter outer membrane factor (OMF) lipoprotein